MEPTVSSDACCLQRGLAAEIRQKDDNSGRRILTDSERDFVNEIIHDRRMDHRPEFYRRLQELMKKCKAHGECHSGRH